MTSYSWGKMPNWWQSNPEYHQKISSHPQVGAAIGGLKLYVDLCCRANFNASTREPVAGAVKQPLKRLLSSIGVSKPTLIAGIRLLEEWGLVSRVPGRPQTLVLANYNSRSWTKLPAGYLRDGQGTKLARIAALPARGETTRRALQLYLYLASIRRRSTLAAIVTYDRIGKVLGCSRNEVSSALSVLSGSELVTVRRPEQLKSGDYACNIYTLLGSATTPLKVSVDDILAGSGTSAVDDFDGLD